MRFRTQLYLMLAPFIVGLILLVVVPSLGSLVVAFFNYSPLKPTQFPWVGLQQFIALKDDPLFWTALGNSHLYTAASVPLRMLGVMAVALFLTRRRRGTSAYNSSAYLPTIIPDVAYALTWLWIFNPLFGPVSQVLKSFGGQEQAWLLDTGGARS